MMVVPFSTKRLKDRLKDRLKRLKRLKRLSVFFQKYTYAERRIVNIY